MPTTARLSHRHQPSTTSSTSSTSSSSSTRPALQRILTNSPSNAVHLSRSTARTSRRVRSHWFSHFALNWRRSSRSSKLFLASSMTLMAVQVIASIIVLTFSWEMYCDKPLRIFITVYILRLALASPLTVYLHLIPRRLQQQQILQQQQQQQPHSHLHSQQQHSLHNASLSQQYNHHLHHQQHSRHHHHHRLVSAENRAEAGEIYPMTTLATPNNTTRVPTTTTNATTNANATTNNNNTTSSSTTTTATATATTTSAHIQALSSPSSSAIVSSPPTPSPPTAPAASLMSPPSSDHQQYYHLHHHFNHQQQQQQASSLPPSVMAQAPPPNIMHRTSRPEVFNPLYADTTLTHWIDRAKSALDMFGLLWFIIGNYMLFTSSTCSETAVPLYYLSLVVIVYNYLIISVPIFLCTAVIFCLPCVLVGMRIIHVEDAVDMGGASSAEIATIPVYQFKSNKSTTTSPAPVPNHHPIGSGGAGGAEEIEIHELPLSTTTTKQAKKMMAGERMEPSLSFLDHLWVRLGFVSDNGQQDQQEPEFDTIEIPNEQDQVCAICLSTYDDGDILCQLWCNHHFHRTCVHEWLALNSRCPMCKRDCRGKPYPEERRSP